MLRHHSRVGRCGHASGFTLIELLVVITIIAVLAAILLPVFARAREKARQVACGSNERQFALAIQMYTEDYDEALPPSARLPDLNEILPAGEPALYWYDLVNPYVHSGAVHLCQDDTGAGRNSYGVNEILFADLTDPGSLQTPICKLAALQTPGDTVMLGDIGTGDDLQTDRPDAYKMTAPDYPLNDNADARPSARHTNRVNVAFMDGHVRSLLLAEFYTSQTPPDRAFQP